MPWASLERQKLSGNTFGYSRLSKGGLPALMRGAAERITSYDSWLRIVIAGGHQSCEGALDLLDTCSLTKSIRMLGVQMC